MRAGDAVGDAGRDFGTSRVAGGALCLLSGSSGGSGTGRLSTKLHAHLATELIEPHRRINHITEKQSCPQPYQHLGCLVHTEDYRTLGASRSSLRFQLRLTSRSLHRRIKTFYQTHKKYKFSHHLRFQLKSPSFFSRIPIKAFELT